MTEVRHRTLWVATGAVVGGVVLWAVLRFGVLAWMSDEGHPIRAVVEALSWLAGIGGMGVGAAALVIARIQVQISNSANNVTLSQSQARAGSNSTSSSKYAVDTRGSQGVQLGDNNTQNNQFG